MRKGFRFAPLSFAVLALVLTACPSAGGGGGVGSAPQITSFTANPESITAAGQAVALSWTVTNGVTDLEIDQGVGAVSGTSQVVYPTAATTYTLTATNSSGETSASVSVGLGTGPGTGPGVEDGLPPSGTFGVSLTQGDFQSDQSGSIADASDPRIIRVQPGGTFYALVSYEDSGGIAGATIYIANRSPPGLRANLVQGQDVGGFTLNGEVSGCVLDGTQTSVTCIYEIAVGSIPNITELPGVSGEFAYVFRTRVTDAAGTVSDTPPRGYVIVGSGSGTPTPPGTPNPPGNPDPPPGNPNPPGNPDPPGNPGPPENEKPVAAFTYAETESNASGVSYRFSGAGSTDPDGDSLSYAWTFGDNTGANTRDHTKKYTRDGDYTVKLTVLDGKGGSDTETKTVEVDVPGSSNPPGNPPENPPGNPPGNPPATAPTITSFTVNPTSITSGQSATLSWAISGTATEVTISPSGGNVTNDPDKKITVTPTTTTTYTINAKNGTVTSTSKTATVTVTNGGTTNKPPTANAGANQDDVAQNATVTLNGSGTDSDGTIASYAWTLVAPDGKSAALSNPTSNKPTFTASQTGKYVASLKVKDNDGAESAADTVDITVASDDNPAENQRPTADAGRDQSDVSTNATVFLDGSRSSDPNPGDTLTYAWTLKKDGVDANNLLNNENTSKPTFKPSGAGTHVASLIVTDNRNLSSLTDTVTITVVAPPTNRPPVANAGPDQTRVVQSNTVTLNGSGSSDPDEDETATLKFAWTLKAPAPGGADVSSLLNNRTTATPTFNATEIGEYVASLVVTDIKGAPSPSTSQSRVSIFVIAP